MEAHLKHGAFSWNELTTNDPKAALNFYSRIFGWKTEVMHLGHMDYTLVKVGDNSIGGVMASPPDAPTSWTPYVTVDNIDDTVKQAQSLGATVCVPPTDIPEVGRFAVMSDPQGAVFAAISYLKK